MTMKKILNIETIDQCNKILGEKTLHPLVSVVDLSCITQKCSDVLKADFYSILLKEYTSDHFFYGRKIYDFSDGTILFTSPNKTLEIDNNKDQQQLKGWLLNFHPKILSGTYLDMQMNAYTFFKYNKEEALHISFREKKILMQGFENIRDELNRPIDKHSQILISKSIDLLLKYCQRFYDRQFIVRSEENKRLIKKAESVIHDYYTVNNRKLNGLSMAIYSAEKLNVSPVYFIDLLKQETGQTANEFIQSKQMEIAQKWLTNTNKSISEIGTALGFPSTEYFCKLFEKLIGYKPEQCRFVN